MSCAVLRRVFARCRWRPLACAVILLLWAPRPAAAFEWEEHSRLADLALWLAYERACAAAPDEAGCAAALALLPMPCCAPIVCEPQSSSHTFGTFTAAPDLFTYTERVVPDPASCQSRNRRCCPKDLFEACHGAELGADCYSQVVERTVDRIEERRGFIQLPLRFLAVHLNTDHFREFAARSYTQLHRRAVRQAREDAFDLALRTEAVALHFLHDLFAPGHLASARSDASDPTAASLHDRFNGHGLPFRVAPDPKWCTDLAFLEGRLHPGGGRCQQQPAPAVKVKKSIVLGGDDVAALSRVLAGCNGGGGSYRAVGDTFLFDRKKRHRAREGGDAEREAREGDRRAHRTFLVLAGAASIEEVLKKTPEDQLLGMCFQRQSAIASGKKREAPPAPEPEPAAEEMADERKLMGAIAAGECSDGPPAVAAAVARRRYLPDRTLPIWAPSASLVRGGSLPDGAGLCYPDLPGALGGYATRWDSEAGWGHPLRGLQKLDPSVGVVELVWSPFRLGKGVQARLASRWEVGWTFRALVPNTELAHREPSENGDRIQPVSFKSSGRDMPFAFTAAFHREEQPSFNATGVGLQVQYTKKFGPRGAWDSFYIVEPGFARYDNPVRRTTRWRGSIRAGIGLSLVFLEVGAERGYELDALGAGDREWRYFAGTRYRVPTSWARKLR